MSKTTTIAKIAVTAGLSVSSGGWSRLKGMPTELGNTYGAISDFGKVIENKARVTTVEQLRESRRRVYENATMGPCY
jgi:hypothetical protein